MKKNIIIENVILKKRFISLKIKFIRCLIYQFFDIKLLIKLFKVIFKNKKKYFDYELIKIKSRINMNSTELNTKNILHEIEHSLSLKIVIDLFKQPKYNKLKPLFIWTLMHEKGAVNLVKKLLPSFTLDSPFYPDKVRIIDAQGGEFLKIKTEGMSYSAVMSNKTDTFVNEAKFIDKSKEKCIKKLMNFKSLARNFTRHNFKSFMLFDANSTELAFQSTGLLFGKTFGKSLWSGKIIESHHSFVVQLDQTQQPYIFTLFHDREPWYLMIGSYRGTKNYIYLPGRNLLILLRSQDSEWYKIDDYIQGFAKLSQQYLQPFLNYLECSTKPAIYSCGISNLGHFFWNEVQGLYNLKKTGIFTSVIDVVLYKNQYLNMLCLFPDLATKNLHYPVTTDDVFLNCLENKLFTIHPTSLSMTSDCAAHIREVSYQLTDESTKNQIIEVKNSNIIIWFNLRVHNKSWVNQLQGLIVICNYLIAKYKNVSLILDGLFDCSSLVESIKNNLSDKVILIDGTSIPLAHSISWASNADFYVSTIGSGLCINTWIAEKKGVAHSETSHLGQMGMWKDVRQDLEIPLTPMRNEVVNLGKDAYCNYYIEPSVILDLVKKII